jgi:hypothetical protein
MADIIRTWPAAVPAKTVAEIFSDIPFGDFYFTLGRGKPKQPIERLWWTYQGRILGSFKVKRIVQNDGTLPRLSRLDGQESEWHIRPDHWVAICTSGCDRIRERVFYSGFRGFRYFDFNSYKNTPAAGIRL